MVSRSLIKTLLFVHVLLLYGREVVEAQSSRSLEIVDPVAPGPRGGLDDYDNDEGGDDYLHSAGKTDPPPLSDSGFEEPKYGPAPPSVTPPMAVVPDKDLAQLTVYEQELLKTTEEAMRKLDQDDQQSIAEENALESQIAQQTKQMGQDETTETRTTTIVETSTENIHAVQTNLHKIESAIAQIQSQLAPLLTKVNQLQDKLQQLHEAESVQREALDKNTSMKERAERQQQTIKLNQSSRQMNLAEAKQKLQTAKNNRLANQRVRAEIQAASDRELEDLHQRQLNALKQHPLRLCPSAEAAQHPEPTLPDLPEDPTPDLLVVPPSGSESEQSLRNCCHCEA